jgi:cytochrome c-type biogenesis protein CcmF
MFVFVAFVGAVVVQEFWRGAAARSSMTGEPLPRALAQLVGRNRRRYGGYVVHLGIAVLLLGVAGSSAFLSQRDVRLEPGQSVKVGDYTLTYQRPTALLSDDRDGTGAPISLGATMLVRKGDQTTVVHPSRNFYPTTDPSKGAVSRYFEGEANSEVDVRWGLRRDLWTAIRPDTSSLEKPIVEADRKFADVGAEGLALIVGALLENYRNDPPPATFRVIVSPLVSWIWLGGLLAVLGALVAAWPSPEARLRRVRALYSARLGRELSRPQT